MNHKLIMDVARANPTSTPAEQKIALENTLKEAGLNSAEIAMIPAKTTITLSAQGEEQIQQLDMLVDTLQKKLTENNIARQTHANPTKTVSIEIFPNELDKLVNRQRKDAVAQAR